MKTLANIIISHLAFLAFFGGVAFAFAQEESTATAPTPERIEQFEERKAVKEENTEARQEQVADRKVEKVEKRAQLSERAQERVINLAANMSNRVDATIARMQNIMDRISSRIEILEESGGETSEASSVLASAQISIDSAREAMASIDSEVEDAVGSEDARQAWQGIKTKFTTVRDHLKTAHSEIKAAVSALKSSQEEKTEGRTTENSNETPE